MNATQPQTADLGSRKTQHLEICLDPERHIETDGTRLDQVHLVHQAIPALDTETIDPRGHLLGLPTAQPFFISSMTGGSDAGYRTNKLLADVAQELGIAVGMGSIRILLRKPEVLDHFMLKRQAPKVPVFANIGAVQLGTACDRIVDLIDRLEVDGIAIHLNPAQELFQSDGDRDFRRVRDSIAAFIEASPVPVIVKETGMGIHPGTVADLFALGARYVNVAGSGGTNWVRVESYRDDGAAASAPLFDRWGIPTALALAALGRNRRGVLASGGIRNGLEIAKAIALGAEAVGLALPFVRAIKQHGVAGGVELGRRLARELWLAMALSGSATLGALRGAPLWLDGRLEHDAAALAHATREPT